ncbi:hypothetical protein CIPAW_08G107600 [Carya illinoinensis]|uniref:Uncharacterized protein n=1 Tax=Carya illinoinensis TaxID=32201 RepID=A0A8T1PUZ1_CARIL|nr:hypothetical protein CIPAW_08G107600 [Carya illinoinensis]
MKRCEVNAFWTGMKFKWNKDKEKRTVSSCSPPFRFLLSLSLSAQFSCKSRYKVKALQLIETRF